MRVFSQRRTFVVFMTVFAVPFVIVISRLKLGQQADLLSDSLKIGLLVAMSTILISFVTWTITHFRKASIIRGALAGLISSLLIIPIPSAAWRLKSMTLSAYQDTADTLFEAVISAVPHAIASGLYTFVDITKASLVAVVASVILGGVIARYIPKKTKV